MLRMEDNAAFNSLDDYFSTWCYVQLLLTDIDWHEKWVDETVQAPLFNQVGSLPGVSSNIPGLG